jgi:radical SAM protein with 4Fe4S-binding SPASM domain
MRRLGPDVRLEMRQERAVLAYRDLPGEAPVPPLELHPLLAAVLALLDRGQTEAEITGRLCARLAQPQPPVREIVDDAVACFKGHYRQTRQPDGHAGEDSNAALDPERLLDEAAARGGPFRTRDVVLLNDRAPFPITLQWLVTRYCNRRCVYCYAGAIAGAKALDADLPASRIREIVREAARLGAYNIFLTGGEPLLRPDAYDVLVTALGLGMEPLVVSKQLIPAAAADRLAAAGLPEIYLSIDSLDPAEARTLIGVRTFARDIAATVSRLASRGIRVNVKSVLTSRNADHLTASWEELDRLGASEVRMEVYSDNLQRHSDSLRPSEEQIARAVAEVERFQAAGHALRLYFEPPGAVVTRRFSDPETDCFICLNGFTSLLFLPDGRVARCDKQLPGDEMVVGSLRTASVHEVWSSPAMLASLKPPRELYRGTDCYDCGYFDVCHQRGRCYYDAYLTSGTLYGPQTTCFHRHDGKQPPAC